MVRRRYNIFLDGHDVLSILSTEQEKFIRYQLYAYIAGVFIIISLLFFMDDPVAQ